MSQDLATFLAWFDGFSENIRKQPSPEQWRRIKDRIGKLTVQDVSVTASGPAQIPARPAAKPTTEVAWKAHYQAALMESGLDFESASEMAGEVTVNMAADPAEVARNDAGAMIN